MQTHTTQGQGAEAQQARPDPINDAYRTLQRLEPGIVAIDPNLVMVSVAVSLKRIAETLSVLVGQHSYEHGQGRIQMEKVTTAIQEHGDFLGRVMQRHD
jgi:hypothetical protein